MKYKIWLSYANQDKSKPVWFCRDELTKETWWAKTPLKALELALFGIKK